GHCRPFACSHCARCLIPDIYTMFFAPSLDNLSTPQRKKDDLSVLM
uniref:Uncharacterized protein n=1 Tax=Aegilops tauschii subsp. strangulata TaxID=200361 RepID=A0A453DEB5_AEGTS